MLRIGVLLGDDIGLEVVPEAVKVMKAAAAAVGLEIEWQEFPIGLNGHNLHGNTLPAVTEQGLRETDGFITGPIGHSAYPRNDPTWIMPPLRKCFDLFASVKPVKSYPNLPSIHKDVDIVFVRETTEGMQTSGTVVAGSGEFRPNDEISIGMRVVTRKGANRVAREAFEIARTRPRRKVTAVHKEATYRLVCGMFAEECRKAAKDYPDVTLEEIHIDSTAMIRSGKMLYEWLGRKRNEPKATRAAALVDQAMDRVIAEAKSLTRDLGGAASTSQMGDAVASAIPRG
jgi:3-isopropylmalate dehydrogenase